MSYLQNALERPPLEAFQRTSDPCNKEERRVLSRIQSAVEKDERAVFRVERREVEGDRKLLQVEPHQLSNFISRPAVLLRHSNQRCTLFRGLSRLHAKT